MTDGSILPGSTRRCVQVMIVETSVENVREMARAQQDLPIDAAHQVRLTDLSQGDRSELGGACSKKHGAQATPGTPGSVEGRQDR